MIKDKEEKKRGYDASNAKAWKELQDAINFSIANNSEARERQTPHAQAHKEAMLLKSLSAYKKRGSELA